MSTDTIAKIIAAAIWLVIVAVGVWLVLSAMVSFIVLDWRAITSSDAGRGFYALISIMVYCKGLRGLAE